MKAVMKMKIERTICFALAILMLLVAAAIVSPAEQSRNNACPCCLQTVNGGCE